MMMRKMRGMKKNSTIKEIRDKLMDANSVLIFPHILMDGDTLGSSIALARGLRKMGKAVYVIIEDEIPAYLKFLDDGSCTFDQDIIKTPDISISVDCTDTERFVLRKEKFFSSGGTLSIDHHKTSEFFADMNYVDADAAATAEIIYELLHEMGTSIDKLAGEAIYAGILTDTGKYQYANTRAESHRITVELFEKGIDSYYVNRMLYQNNRIEKLYIAGKIFTTLKAMADGKAVMAYVTREMLAESGALLEDTEGISEVLRNISGVELSIFAKETGQAETKFSMRSKMWVDVSEISAKYKGGGHTNAAGCTIMKPINEAMKMIEADVEEYFVRAALKNDN